MKMPVFALLVVAALLSVACGEGRAIFNVDVHSFIQGTGQDTLVYIIPPSSTGSASSVPQKINLLPGLGSSIVESATLTGGANLINANGTGTIGFQFYVAATDTGTNNPAALAIDVPETSVSGTNTSLLTITGGLTPAVLDLLSESEVWIRIVVKGTNNDPFTPVTGEMALTALQLRIVFQDKIL